MSSITIYGYGTTLVRAVIKPDDNSQQQVTMMQEDILALSFSSPVAIKFQIGDYCTMFGKLYQVNQLPARERLSERRIQYTLQMEAEFYDLGKVDYLFLDSENHFTEPIFPLRGTLQDFGDLIIHNLNRVFPTADWKLGLVEVTDFATIQFNAQNCLQALQSIVQQFDTEYLIVGKTINLKQIQQSSNLLLMYGKNKPLYKLKESPQNSSNVITRLYAYGSTKNITADYRSGAQRLQLGATSYIEKNTELYRVQESIKIFDGTNGTIEIYPHRTGTISDVDAFTPVDDTTFTFEDIDIDFNINDNLIPGVTAQIVFNSGQLSGYTFDINSFNNSTKKITINVSTSDPNFIVPSASFQPHIGDQYVITNISLPQAYIDDAEAALMSAAQEYLDRNCIPPVTYTVTCNSKWFKDNNRSFNLGDTVAVEDDALMINKTTRITGFTRKINNIFEIGMTLADTVQPKTIIVKLINGI